MPSVGRLRVYEPDVLLNIGRRRYIDPFVDADVPPNVVNILRARQRDYVGAFGDVGIEILKICVRQGILKPDDIKRKLGLFDVPLDSYIGFGVPLEYTVPVDVPREYAVEVIT
jgi:hypothetical protein